MSFLFSEGVNTSETDDETRSLTGQKLGDIISTGSRQSISVTLEEVAQQIKTVTDSLTKQLELLCDLMKELCQAPLRRSEETSGLIQGCSIVPNPNSDCENERQCSCNDIA